MDVGPLQKLVVKHMAEGAMPKVMTQTCIVKGMGRVGLGRSANLRVKQELRSGQGGESQTKPLSCLLSKCPIHMIPKAVRSTYHSDQISPSPEQILMFWSPFKPPLTSNRNTFDVVGSDVQFVLMNATEMLCPVLREVTHTK